jgi:hypothetical protein
MRNFSFITVGKILKMLEKDGLKISRPTFYKLEERLGFPNSIEGDNSLSWRVYSPTEADDIVKQVKKEYKFE